MPYTKFIELLIPTIATILSVYVETLLHENGHFIAWSGASLVLLISILLLSMIWLQIRKAGFFDERFLMLGEWVEYTDTDSYTHISFFNIEYSVFSDSFVVSGDTWDMTTFRLHAEWSSISVSFPDRHYMYYIHKSRIIGTIGDISGLTRLHFSFRNHRYNDGAGYILDDDATMTRVDFLFERLDKEDIYHCLNKTSIDTMKDKEAYLLHCFDKRTNPHKPRSHESNNYD